MITLGSTDILNKKLYLRFKLYQIPSRMTEDQWNRLPPTALNIKSNTSTFIARWAASGAAERANAQSFITELCALLSLEPPQPKTPDESDNVYVFEKTIPSTSGNKNFIDCYKRGHFVLESKQGADADTREAALSLSGEQQRAQRKTGHGQRGSKAWDTAMDKARAQAEKYVRSLPRQELTDGGRPPFIMVVDVGHSIALYTDWPGSRARWKAAMNPSKWRASSCGPCSPCSPRT